MNDHMDAFALRLDTLETFGTFMVSGGSFRTARLFHRRVKRLAHLTGMSITETTNELYADLRDLAE